MKSEVNSKIAVLLEDLLNSFTNFMLNLFLTLTLRYSAVFQFTRADIGTDQVVKDFVREQLVAVY